HNSWSKGCATITITPFDTISWPKILIIDFGINNCLCNDGKYRRGKIVCTITGRYRDSLTVITDSLDNFYLNNYHIQGVKIVTNRGHNSNGYLNYSVEVYNARIFTLTGVIQWNSSRTREWVYGEYTPWPNIWDDVYLITGSASGNNRFGNSFSIDIQSPLRVEIGCKWIVSGTLQINPIGNTFGVIDYGPGNCDDQAIITVNGKNYPFTLN
ncbi:hypothetical protein ACFL6I_27155, partial [candidate division KSB1 bacterium]